MPKDIQLAHCICGDHLWLIYYVKVLKCNLEHNIYLTLKHVSMLHERCHVYVLAGKTHIYVAHITGRPSYQLAKGAVIKMNDHTTSSFLAKIWNKHSA